MLKVERIFRAAYAYAAVINASITTPEISNSERKRRNQAAQRELLEALDCSTAADFNLTESIGHMRRQDAPIGYMGLHEDKWFSLGIFVVFKGSRIPLHDHPGMEGALKVIAGNFVIKSYTVTGRSTSGTYLTAREAPSLLVNNSHPPEVLEPDEKNIHEIEYADVVDDASLVSSGNTRPYAAFIDFLSPPYGSRVATVTPDEVCHYYEILSKDDNRHPSIVTLQRCNASTSYWTEEIPYLGSPLRDVIQQLRTKYPESC